MLLNLRCDLFLLTLVGLGFRLLFCLCKEYIMAQSKAYLLYLSTQMLLS